MGKKKNLERISKYSNMKIENDAPNYHTLTANEAEDILVKKSNDFKQINILAKADDLKQENPSQKKTFKAIKFGFINANNKEEFIKLNEANIKKLSNNKQNILMQLFFRFL